MGLYLWNCKECKQEYLDTEVPVDYTCIDCKKKYNLVHNSGY